LSNFFEPPGEKMLRNCSEKKSNHNFSEIDGKFSKIRLTYQREFTPEGSFIKK